MNLSVCEICPPISFERGVKQGCPLSPTLFSIFINDLIDCLNKEIKGITSGLCQVHALLYADNLVLIGDKPETLKDLLQALNWWCTENNMDINLDKSKIISETQESTYAILHLHAEQHALIIQIITNIKV